MATITPGVVGMRKKCVDGMGQTPLNLARSQHGGTIKKLRRKKRRQKKMMKKKFKREKKKKTE